MITCNNISIGTYCKSGASKTTNCCRLFINLPAGDLRYDLVLTEFHEALQFFSMLGHETRDGLIKSPMPRKIWTASNRYLPYGGRLLPKIRDAEIVHLTHFETFPKNLPTKTKTVLTIHDMIFTRHPEWFTSRNLNASQMSINQIMNRQIDLVITPSIHTAEMVSEYGYRGRVEVTHLAPTSLLEHKTHLSIEESRVLHEKPFALFLGNLEPRKGIHFLLNAWRLSNAKSDLRLVLIGKTAYLANEIQEEIDRAIAEGLDILQLGFVSENFKSVALRLARFLVYPTMDEGFGIPVLDAMSLGLPVISSKAGSIPEIAGDSALLTEVGEIEEIANCIDNLTYDDELHARYSKAGKVKSSSYSWAKTSQLTYHLYKDLLS